MKKHNNRKSTPGRRIQTILSAPGKIRVGKAGKVIENKVTGEMKRLHKNKYKPNPDAKPVKQIIHN